MALWWHRWHWELIFNWLNDIKCLMHNRNECVDLRIIILNCFLLDCFLINWMLNICMLQCFWSVCYYLWCNIAVWLVKSRVIMWPGYWPLIGWSVCYHDATLLSDWQTDTSDGPMSWAWSRRDNGESLATRRQTHLAAIWGRSWHRTPGHEMSNMTALLSTGWKREQIIWAGNLGHQFLMQIRI